MSDSAHTFWGLQVSSAGTLLQQRDIYVGVHGVKESQAGPRGLRGCVVGVETVLSALGFLFAR